MIHDVFWLAEGVTLQSNSARKGDSDYGTKGATRGQIKKETAAKSAAKKAAGKKRGEEKARAKGGGSQPGEDAGGRLHGTGEKGGQFVSKGDSGKPVEDVQAKLHQPVTGQYDTNTAAAVIAFQKKHNLVADGVIGRQTALALNGEFSRARRVGPGRLGPVTAPMVGKKYDGKGRPSPKAKKRAAKRRGSEEQMGGGRLMASEDQGLGADLLESVRDRRRGGQFKPHGAPQGKAEVPKDDDDEEATAAELALKLHGG